MSIYSKIRTAAASQQKELSDESVYKIAGTLRFTFGDDAPLSAILRELANTIEVKADVEKLSATEAIANALERGMCPRCSKGMTEVKLADNTPAKYCTDCRISLW